MRKSPLTGVLFVDAGLALLLLGLVSLFRPLWLPGIRSRPVAGVLVGLGLSVICAGMALPAPLRRVTRKRTRLDDFAPVYQFSESHFLRVHVSANRVFAAIRSVTAREIRFFRLLTWIRSPRLGPARESILAPAANRPILDVALGSGFVLLAEEPGREIVIGTILGRGKAVSEPAFAAFDHPGFSKAAMNFLVEEEPEGWCRVSTETRVFSTDDSARRAFALYWRLIYPGSSLIRRMWLRAVRDRAEAIVT